MAIASLPPAPLRTDDPDTFIAKTDAFLPALNQLVAEINAAVAGLNSVAAGGAYTFGYTFITGTTDTDPGAGNMKFSSTTLNTATTLRFDTVAGNGVDITNIFTDLANAVGTVKGSVRLVKASDPSRWMIFDITAVAGSSSYRNLTVVHRLSTQATPFVVGDNLLVYVDKAGEKGSIGPAGTLLRRVMSGATYTTLTANADNTDLHSVTAQASALTVAAPSGTPIDGQSLMFRIKDNGAARLITWNSVFRGGTDLILPPTTTAGKWIYVGYCYNAADAKWDLVALLNGI